jgi:hypothetical protein
MNSKMRRLLDCDFFLAEEDVTGQQHGERLRVFSGPRGIVIADARVQLSAGTRVRHGEAFASAAGVEFVFYQEEDGDADSEIRVLEMRFVVKGARYDGGTAYSLRPAPASARIAVSAFP